MNRFIRLGLCLFIALGFSCAKRNQENTWANDKVFSIRIYGNEEHTSLYEFIEKVEFISLESGNESFLANITDLKVKDNMLYIQDGDRRIAAFDEYGEFIRKADFIGLGPGEYKWINSFDISEEGRLYIYDLNSRAVRLYDSSFKFIKTYKIPYNSTDGFGVVENDEPRFVFTTNYNYAFDPEIGDFSLITVRGNKIVNRFIPFTLPEPTMYSNPRQFLNLKDYKSVFSWEGGLTIHLPFDPYIYHYIDGSVKPTYVLDFGEKKFPYLELIADQEIKSSREFYIEANKYSRGPYNVMESSKYLFFQYHEKKEFLCCLLKKDQNDFLLFSTLDEKILPIFRIPILLDQEFLYFKCEAITIIDYMRDKDIEFFNSLDLPKNLAKELIQLSKTISAEDNPIIVKVKIGF